MYANWSPRVERRYDEHGVLQSIRIQRTPHGPWEDYDIEETIEETSMDNNDWDEDSWVAVFCAICLVGMLFFLYIGVI